MTATTDRSLDLQFEKDMEDGLEKSYNEGVKDTLTDLKEWIEAYLMTLIK